MFLILIATAGLTFASVPPVPADEPAIPASPRSGYQCTLNGVCKCVVECNFSDPNCNLSDPESPPPVGSRTYQGFEPPNGTQCGLKPCMLLLCACGPRISFLDTCDTGP